MPMGGNTSLKVYRLGSWTMQYRTYISNISCGSSDEGISGLIQQKLCRNDFPYGDTSHYILTDSIYWFRESLRLGGLSHHRWEKRPIHTLRCGPRLPVPNSCNVYRKSRVPQTLRILLQQDPFKGHCFMAISFHSGNYIYIDIPHISIIYS